MNLLAQYQKVLDNVETQSCEHGEKGARQTGREWVFCCGISYEYLNDISVRDQLAKELEDKRLSQAEMDLLAKLDERLKALLRKNGVNPDQKDFWRNGLPFGVEP